MELGGGCQVGRSVSKGPEDGWTISDSFLSAAPGALGTKPDLGLGEIISKPLQAVVWFSVSLRVHSV